MDESDFDKIIKDKLDNFEDPEFDQSAFDALSIKLDNSGSVPWWRSNTTLGIVITTAIITTILNTANILRPGLKEDLENDQVVFFDNRIDSLIAVIHQLKSQSILSKQVQTITSANLIDNTKNQVQIKTRTVPYVLISDTTCVDDEVHNTTGSMISKIWRSPEIPRSKLVFASSNIIKSRRKQHEKSEISASMRNKLEKHYFTGLGLYLAPHVDGNISFWKTASGIPGYKTGIAADVVVSPRLSLEANLDFVKVRSMIRDGYESVPVQPYNDFGKLSGIVTTNNLLGSNVSIKYRQWISEKDQFFIKTGVSPYFSTGGKYELTYNALSGYDRDDSKPVSQVQKFEKRQYFGTTVTLGAGITRTHLQKNKVELGLFYERSVGSNNINGNSLQLAGIRGAYWFHVR